MSGDFFEDMCLAIDTDTIDGEEYDSNESREVYLREQEEAGYKVVLPKTNELQIDMDTGDAYALFKKQLASLKKEYPSIECKIAPSRNGLPGRHATIEMPFDMEDSERIAWQAALGSDPFRELMSLFRLRKGDEHPTLFLENSDRELTGWNVIKRLELGEGQEVEEKSQEGHQKAQAVKDTYAQWRDNEKDLNSERAFVDAYLDYKKGDE